MLKKYEGMRYKDLIAHRNLRKWAVKQSKGILGFLAIRHKQAITQAMRDGWLKSDLYEHYALPFSVESNIEVIEFFEKLKKIMERGAQPA